MSMRQIAQTALGHFREGEREAEHHGGKVTVLDSDAPEWLSSIVYPAGQSASDFRVEAVQAALLSAYDEDDFFEPQFTEAHSRASYFALAHDSDLREMVDKALSSGDGYRNMSALISHAATEVMSDLSDRVRSALESRISDDLEV